MSIRDRIRELKLTVPSLVKPQGLYVPAVKSGKHIMTSGQLPMVDGRLIFKGRVGKEVTLDNAKRAARAAVCNVLAAVEWAAGDLDRVKQVLRMNGYVCSAIGFQDQPKVLNDASELLIQVFGEDVGAHTRTAIGCLELPLGACVEIDLLVEVK